MQLVNTSDTSGTAGTAQGFQIINNGNDGAVNILNYKSTPMAFWTAGTERMRLDSSGNLLVGKTISSSATVGITLEPAGAVVATRDGGECFIANRKTSDGTIIQLRKDQTTVGSIGVNNANNTFIGSAAADHTGLEFGNDILPRKGSNTADNQTDLGSSSIRFKDLHLGGTAYAGNVVSQVAINAQTGTTYTTVLADQSKLVTLTNASAITLTIPANSSVAYPVGTKIDFAQLGAGQVTVAGAGGVTVNATPTLKFRDQYSAVSCIKTATDTWLLVGDLES